jgi:hypothetical protein
MNFTPKQVILFFLSGGGVVICLMAAQFWISVEVGKQLASAGIVPEAEIAIMQGDIEENADDIIRVESKAERIAQILMEE